MLIYNLDKTGISVVYKPGCILTELGRKQVWSVTSGEKGKTHTVLVCVGNWPSISFDDDLPM